jgi:hypothetical protein
MLHLEDGDVVATSRYRDPEVQVAVAVSIQRPVGCGLGNTVAAMPMTPNTARAVTFSSPVYM